jgi:hypothetical protein
MFLHVLRGQRLRQTSKAAGPGADHLFLLSWTGHYKFRDESAAQMTHPTSKRLHCNLNT